MIDRSGIGTYIRVLTSLQREHGHTVRHFGIWRPQLEHEEDAQFYPRIDPPGRVKKTSSPMVKMRGAANAIWSQEAANQLQAFVDHHAFDVVHLHYIRYGLSPSILPVLKNAGLPTVYTLHSYELVCPRSTFYSERNGLCEKCRVHRYYHAPLENCTPGGRIQGFFAAVELAVVRTSGVIRKNVDQFIAPSRFLMEKYVEYGFHREELCYLPNAVDPTQFSSFLTDADDGYCVFVGSLRRLKGVYTLLEAARQLPRIPFLIVGDGLEYDSMQRIISRDELHNVTMTGRLSGDELKSVVANARMVVTPSEFYENGSMAVLEALALGKPVVGARIGGIPEYIDDDPRCGMLFESGNAQDLAEKIAYLHARPELARDLGRNARRKAETIYSTEQHYRSLMDIYAQVGAGRAA